MNNVLSIAISNALASTSLKEDTVQNIWSHQANELNCCGHLMFYAFKSVFHKSPEASADVIRKSIEESDMIRTANENPVYIES
jgi:hypothetical protein